jgi:heme-degrading monooxygenase HmoA
MIVEYIRYRIPEDEAPSFEDAYRRAAASFEASPHCERYEVARCTEDPAAYTVRIERDSADGHPQAFRNSPEFRSFFTAARPDRGDAPLRGQDRRPEVERAENERGRPSIRERWGGRV